MVVRGDSVYVVFRNEVARFRDTDGDGVPDKREAAKRLGLALSSLYRKLEELQISGKSGEDSGPADPAARVCIRNSVPEEDDQETEERQRS